MISRREWSIKAIVVHCTVTRAHLSGHTLVCACCNHLHISPTGSSSSAPRPNESTNQHATAMKAAPLLPCPRPREGSAAGQSFASSRLRARTNSYPTTNLRIV